MLYIKDEEAADAVLVRAGQANGFATTRRRTSVVDTPLSSGRVLRQKTCTLGRGFGNVLHEAMGRVGRCEEAKFAEEI